MELLSNIAKRKICFNCKEIHSVKEGRCPSCGRNSCYYDVQVEDLEIGKKATPAQERRGLIKRLVAECQGYDGGIHILRELRASNFEKSYFPSCGEIVEEENTERDDLIGIRDCVPCCRYYARINDDSYPY